MRIGAVSGRAAMALLVLVSWLGIVGWHVRREYFQPDLARLAQAAAALDPGVHFYAVRMGDEVVGLASSRLDTLPQGFRLEEVLNLELRAMAQEGFARASTRVELGPTLEMTGFTFGLTSDAGEFRASGQVEGDSLLRVRVEAGSTPEELTFRLADTPLSAGALPLRLALGGGLQVGRRLQASVFDPSTVSTRTVRVEVLDHDTIMVPDSAVRDPESGRWVGAGERPVPVWKVAERYGGIVVDSWLDQDGRIVRSSSAMGLSLERTVFELIEQERTEARQRRGETDPAGDVIFSTAIAADAALAGLAGRDELAFVLSGVDLEGFDLAGGRQRLRGDTLQIRRERWDELEPGYRLPYPRMDLAEALRPEPLIQSADPAIQDAARRAARGSSDPVVVARRLADEVYGRLDKEITFTLPSARQVLDEGRGDCNEHTVLYVAMARALGLPARPAVGLVHLDGAFFYHAWPEIWLGEWVAVDPTLGQVPAGPTHLRFVTGSLAQQVEVARLIGNLRIRVVAPGPEGEVGP